jgi:hypothetical protein
MIMKNKCEEKLVTSCRKVETGTLPLSRNWEVCIIVRTILTAEQIDAVVKETENTYQKNTCQTDYQADSRINIEVTYYLLSCKQNGMEYKDL